MAFYRRRLPHLDNGTQPVFITWSLYGALPKERHFPKENVNSGKSFTTLDRLLEETRNGPFYLRQPEIAAMIVSSLKYSAYQLNRFKPHAWVVMPNHVHILVSPLVPLPKLTRTLKSFTANQANKFLGRSGQPFWQEESYDHLVRNQDEFDRIRRYIENNPVRAGFVSEPSCYLWSSASLKQEAGGPDRRSGAGQRPAVHQT